VAEFSLAGRRVWLAGHRGLVGSALLRRLQREPVADILTASSAELDLRRQADVERFVDERRPDVVIMSAGRVGGIAANDAAQATFLYDNLIMGANVVEAARRGGVAKTVVLGSSCIYPREAPQPIVEEALLTGPLERTNEGYAVAKIAVLEMAKMYRRQHGMDIIALMPTNLYGPGDNFDLASSHVLPALMRKVHEAKVRGDDVIEVWGTGTPRREFLFSDDLADATMFALCNYSDDSHLNVGTGQDLPIAELVSLIADVVGWQGTPVYDASKPDGTPRKVLDVSRLTQLGWRAATGLGAGLAETYRWFVAQHAATA
jgi:GDP-L-fucose synthase